MRAGFATAVALAAVAGGCGGAEDGGPSSERPALVWQEEPSVLRRSAPEPAAIVQGVIRNQSRRQVELTGEAMVLREADGDPVPGSAVFLSGYVRPGEAQNRGRETLSAQEEERLGRVARIDPGKTAPLVVSWRARDGRPVRVSHPEGSLEIPGG